VPIAAEARRQAATRQQALDVTLCLPPCQFASGQEKRVAAAADVFDRILDPAATFRLSLGLPGWTPPAPTVLLHVGGSFWYSKRLARRWRARAFAFVERAHIARIHHPFERIFLPTPDLADRLIRYGVPAEKLLVTGDPRHDTLPNGALVSRNGNGTPPQVTLLCGSRNPVFSAFFPFWVSTATALRQRLPAVRLRLVVSPYVAPHIQQGIIREHQRDLDAAGIEVAHGGWSHILDSDLVLTIPGANTLELAVLRIPSIVVGPASVAMVIPLEGVLGWITRPPLLGPGLRRLLIGYHKRKPPYLALPNMRAQQRIMPELTGDVTPAEVADESARLLQDEDARRRLVEALATIPRTLGGSRAIVSAIASETGARVSRR
jgi:lipid-A-disaccharide synthase